MTALEKLRFALLSAAGMLIGLSGFAGARFLGRALGRAIWTCLPSRRRLATGNAASHLGLPEKEAARIAKESFLNTGQSFFELLLTQKFSFSSPNLSSDTPETLRELFACGRPIVAITAHFGAWELLASLLGQVYEEPRPRQVIVRKYADPAVHAFITKQREATGAQMIGHRNAILQVMRALRKNGIAAFLADHNTKKNEALFLPFLGEEAAVNAGPALLAVRSGALVWPMVLSRQGSNYVFHLQKPMDTAGLEGTAEEKIRKTAEFYTRALEKFIREEPEQWFWMHNRWKTKKPPENAPARQDIRG